ncbi:MAG TPA: phage holin family protein [Candidatus Handelsmanbacteria bacterium]|jgi:putative membrane protein|nr:phage holin family protein [Candidatus Handelsmanbacteria bacterium]
MSLLLRLAVNAAALWVGAYIVDGVHLSGDPVDILIVAALFGLVNTFIKPVVMLLSLPALLVSLGLFTFVVNAGMLGLVAWLTQGLSIDSPGSALAGSFIVSAVSFSLNMIVKE